MANITRYLNVASQSVTTDYVLQLFLPTGPMFVAVDAVKFMNGIGYGMVGLDNQVVASWDQDSISHFLMARGYTDTVSDVELAEEKVDALYRSQILAKRLGVTPPKDMPRVEDDPDRRPGGDDTEPAGW